MVHKLRKLRDEYGSVFITQFVDDDLIIPWKPISIGDYLEYDRLIKRGIITLAQIEEEVFRKCVTDESFIRQLPYLKAGIISTVAQCIWQYSGPNGVEALNTDLEAARQLFYSSSERAIHEIVQTITLAFPSYKPEEIYSLNYETLIFRLIQAEAKLQYSGIIKEPIRFETKQSIKNKKQSKFANLNPEKKRETAEFVKNAWENTQGLHCTNKQQKSSMPKIEKMPDVPNDKWWDKSPVLESTARHSINFMQEGLSSNQYCLDNHELTEAPEVQKVLMEQKIGETRGKMISDAQWIYKDLVNEFKARNKSKKSM